MDAIMPLNLPPQYGGIWAGKPQRQQAPQEQQKPPGLLDRILGLYGADPNTHIPQDHRQAALGQGLRNAGLSVLQASGQRGHDMVGPAQLIGQAVGAMGQTGQIYGGQLQANQMKQRIQQAIGSGAMSPAQMRAVMMELIAAGGEQNLAAARMIATVLQADQGRAAQPRVLPPGSQLYGAEGNLLAENQNRSGSQGSSLGAPKEVIGPDGQSTFASFDKEANEWVPVGGSGFKPIPKGAGQPTELERRAELLSPMADMAMAEIRNFEQLEGAPSRIAQVQDWAKLNELMPEEAQLLYTAGKQLGDAYLRMTSGAAIKEEEVDMFIRAFLPYPGDTQANIDYKRRARRAFVTGLKNLGARARVQAGSLQNYSVNDVIAIGEEEGEYELPPIGEAWDSLEE